MQFSHSDKTSIAWFKLAEFVGRKEKERALYLFRLLVHSVHDAALVAQLEGDLLAAFGDEKAVDSYERAVQGYLASRRAVHARMLFDAISATISPVMARQYARALDEGKTLAEINPEALPVENTTEVCM